MSKSRSIPMRTWFTGRLETRTALHIGTGSSLSPATNAPLLRGADGLPLIPGSSLKGAMRSASERLLRALGQRACMVFGNEERPVGEQAGEADVEGQVTRCLTTDGKRREWFYGLRSGELKEPSLSQALREWKLSREQVKEFGQNEELQLELLEEKGLLCRACLTWGSPFLAGRIRVRDLNLVPGATTVATEIRDGVGLDRDTGTAAEHIKFDLEVLPAGAVFDFEVIAEPEADLAVVGLAIGELLQGSLPLGGRVTRGLGEVLLKDFVISEVNLSAPGELVSYLVQGRRRQHCGEAALARLESFLNPLTEDASDAE